MQLSIFQLNNSLLIPKQKLHKCLILLFEHQIPAVDYVYSLYSH